MRLEEYNRENLTGRYRRCKLQAIIDEFLESDMDCAEVKDYDAKFAYSQASTLNKAISRMKKDKIVRAMSYNGRVFLIRIIKRGKENGT